MKPFPVIARWKVDSSGALYLMSVRFTRATVRENAFILALPIDMTTGRMYYVAAVKFSSMEPQMKIHWKQKVLLFQDMENPLTFFCIRKSNTAIWVNETGDHPLTRQIPRWLDHQSWHSNTNWENECLVLPNCYPINTQQFTWFQQMD